jgi:degradative hydroxymethylglutaryl-CoA reductase
MSKTSELGGFYRLDIAARRARAAEAAGLPADGLSALATGNGLSDDHADHMVENALGTMGLPLGLCVNMLLDGRDQLIPMAVEEPSVVAGCSYAAKLLRAGGGVSSKLTPPHMVGQIQVLDVADAHAAEADLYAAKATLLASANATNPKLVAVGGGAIDLEVRHLPPMDANDPVGPMLVVHLVVDVRDAMGANAINTMAEALAPQIAEITKGRVGLRILSNLSDRRLVTVEGKVPLAMLEGKGGTSGLALAKGIEEASVFAERDPYRASTHNKGVMNGIDAALIALGQDWRAIEAGAHAFAARSGRYTALSTWRVEGDALVGRMTIPMAVGTVGGVVAVHPTVKANRALVGVAGAGELAALVAACGLAQNLAALRALAAEGIQRGHMRLHARNVAIEAGATGEEIQLVADAIADQNAVALEPARAALTALRSTASADSAPPPSGVATSTASRIDSYPPPSLGEGAAVASKADRAFCDDVLPGVSRTFALSIQALVPELREAICVAYLLCRVVDTVEDDRRMAPEVRGELFDAFDLALANAFAGDGSLGTAFEDKARAAGLGVNDREKHLCYGAGAVFRTFSALPDVQRRAIEPRVAEMSKGMREYSERADRENGLRLRDVEDLEKYCYYVAGTVGELLTDLFRISFPVDARAQRELEARSISFGLGLQLVNILKDVAEDSLRGDCFLPVKEAGQHGIELDNLLAASERPKGLALLRALSARARHHLERAEEYTLLWPAASAAEVRLFCAVPLALALATLREVELGDDALMPNRAPTVSRALVMKVFEDAMNATRIESSEQGNRALASLFDRARTGVVGRPSRPTSTLPVDSNVDDGGPPASDTTTSTGVEARGSVSRGSVQGNEMSDSLPKPKHGLQSRRELGGKLLVTGAAGHVGANLVHRLLSDGHDVRVLLRDGSDNTAIDAIEEALGKKVERVVGDLRKYSDAVTAVKGIDNVFHVAARVSTLGGSDQDLRDLYDCNVRGTAHVLRAAGDAGVKRTVVTGSLSAVGLDWEDPSRPCDESMAFYPFSEHLPYGRTKSLVEHEVLKAVVEGVDALVATSCAVLGPWDYKPSRMGRTLIDFATGKLNAYLPGGFDFVATRDLIDGHVLAMERGRSGQRYILSTEFCTVDQLMDMFEEVAGRPRPKLRLPPGVMASVASVSSFFMSTFAPTKPQRFTPAAVRLLRMSRKADTSKAQLELGYKPTNVRSAIHEAYADFARRGLVPQSPSQLRGDSVAPPASSDTPKKKKNNEGAAA